MEVQDDSAEGTGEAGGPGWGADAAETDGRDGEEEEDRTGDEDLVQDAVSSS